VETLTVKTKEDFEKVWEYIKTQAQEIFEKDKSHTHIIFLISADGSIAPVLFDPLMDESIKLLKTAFAGQDPGHATVQLAKSAVFSYIAGLMRQTRAVGYFQVCEGWALELASETQDPKEAADKMSDVLREHGSLEKAPCRIEILSVIGRFREFHGSAIWTIGRRDEEVWLYNLKENREVRTEKVSRQSEWDDAIDKVIKEKE